MFYIIPVPLPSSDVFPEGPTFGVTTFGVIIIASTPSPSFLSFIILINGGNAMYARNVRKVDG